MPPRQSSTSLGCVELHQLLDLGLSFRKVLSKDGSLFMRLGEVVSHVLQRYLHPVRVVGRLTQLMSEGGESCCQLLILLLRLSKLPLHSLSVLDLISQLVEIGMEPSLEI